MACEYYINGKSDPTHNSILNYVADTAPNARSAAEVLNRLVKGNIVFQKPDSVNPGVVRTYTTPNDTSLKHIQNLNTLAQQKFGLNPAQRLVETPVSEVKQTDRVIPVTVNQANLEQMSAIDPSIIVQNKEVADEVASLLSGPTSPFTMEYERIKNLREKQIDSLDRSRVRVVENQAVKLQQMFRKAGIETNVVFDNNLDARGQISLEDGVPTIRLNPDLMGEDTAYHEFGHLYVDLLGYNNPAVQAAIAELRDTVLYEEVQARYPNLSQEQLDKEVLATAIGLEGAKIERKNPSKLQQLLNRIYRALANLLGIQPNKAAELAQEMFAGKMQVDQFRGSLSPYVQKSVAEKRVEKVVGDLRIKLQTAITKLESQPNPNEQTLADLKLQRDRLEKVESVQDLSNFVNYVARYVATAEATMEHVENTYNPNISEDERLKMMQDIFNISEWIGGFHDAENSSLEALVDLLEDRKLPNNGGSQIELDAFINKLTSSVRRMRRLQQRHMDNIVPMQVDLLMKYHRPDINNSVDQIIENIKKNNRLIGLNKKTKEYRELLARRRAGELDANQYQAELVKLNVQQLQSRKIGRETLIKEFTEAQKNKSWLSYMSDPMIYSSQAGLQMFTTHVKNSMYAAAEESRKTKYALRDIYREYAAKRGEGINEKKFNEPILEEYSYYVTDYAALQRGEGLKKRKVKTLSFVQPVDVGKYYEAEYKMMETLMKKHKRPTSEEELKTWSQSAAGKAYYREMSTWYAQNTVPVPNAQQEFNRLTSKLAALKQDKAQALQAQNVDLAGILDAQIAELDKQINSVYDKFNKTFRGSLTQPSPTKYVSAKYQALTRDKNSVEYRYYEALLDQYKKDQAKLGKTNQLKNSWDTFSYAMPTIRKSALDKGIEGEGVGAVGKDLLQDNFSIMETDTEYGVLVGLNGERLQTVPVFFTNPVDSSDVSQDAVGSIVRFSHMSNMYEQKSRILASVESMKSIIEARGTLEESSSGIPGVDQAARRLRGLRDRVVKQDTSRNPDNHLRHLTEFIDSVFYGEQDLKNNIQGSFDILGKTINVDLSGTKVARVVTLLTSITSLAGNKLQAVNQAMIDNERLVEEGIAGEFFGVKDLAWAKAKLAVETPSAVKDAGAFAPDSKLMQASEFFDALSDFTDRQGINLSGPRLKKAADIGSTFIYQNLAEYETAHSRMLAYMHSFKGKLKDSAGNVIKNEKGQDADLWDMFVKDEKGVYGIDPRVANFNVMDFRNTLASIQKKTNQLKGQFDRSMAERRAVGKVVMLFRKYFLPGFRRRFGHGGLGDLGYLHVDTESGTVSQGMYYNFASFIKEQATGLLNGNPGVWQQLSKEEKANVKRTTMELFFGALSFYLYSLMKGLAADADDEDEKGRYMFWAYQFRRLNTELAQFRSEEIFTTFQAPTAAVRPLKNTIDLVSHIVYKEVPYALGNRSLELEKDIFYQRKSGRYNKGDRKLFKKLDRTIPIWSGINKTAEDAIQWFELNE